jgi:hypothetical protein
MADFMVPVDETPEGRALTAAERRELEHLARRPGPSAWILPTLCWLLTLLDLLYLLTGHMRGFQLFSFGLVLIVTVASTVQLWRGVQLKAQVLDDLDIGTLVKDQVDGEDVEHLPTSSLLWTVEGQPAPWRKKAPTAKG